MHVMECSGKEYEIEVSERRQSTCPGEMDAGNRPLGRGNTAAFESEPMNANSDGIPSGFRNKMSAHPSGKTRCGRSGSSFSIVQKQSM